MEFILIVVSEIQQLWNRMGNHYVLFFSCNIFLYFVNEVLDYKKNKKMKKKKKINIIIGCHQHTVK